MAPRKEVLMALTRLSNTVYSLSSNNSYTPRASRIQDKILEVFFFLCQKGGKNYCWPSQTKVIEILNNVHGISISRRTLNYHLRALEDNGFIRRIRRIKRDKNGRINFNSTLYCLLNKAKKVLKNLIRLVGRCKSHFKALFRAVELEPKLKEFENQEHQTPEEVRRAAIGLLTETAGVV